MIQTFLLTGDLPWWIDKSLSPDINAIMRSLIRIAPAEVAKFILLPAFLHELLEKPSRSVTPMKRWIWQIDAAVRQEIQDLVPWMSLIVAGKSWVDPRKRNVAAILLAVQRSNVVSDKPFRGMAWRMAVMVSSIHYASALTREEIFQVLSTWPEKKLLDLEKRWKQAEKEKKTLAKLRCETQRRLKDPKEITFGQLAQQVKGQTLYILSQLPEKALKELLSNRSSTPTIYETQSRIHIDNAGLCLLANYLPRLFANLGLLDENDETAFRSPKDAFRAILLLQYLATGQRSSPEYLLAFNKLLCGMEKEEATPCRLRLARVMLSEADDLLDAVIANWPALKNTSRDGLRGSFLCRKGILTEREEGWVLQIERKEYDILLNNIGWGYGFIKLPWMKKYITVEW